MNQKAQQKTFQYTIFKEYLRNKMISLLDSVLFNLQIPGKKLLIFDDCVKNNINMIIDKKVLIDHGVPQKGIISLIPQLISNQYSQILVMVSSKISSIKIVCQLIKKNQKDKTKSFTVICCPKKTVIIKQYFQNQNLLNSINLKEFSFDLIPVDIDLFSLELSSFRSLFIDQQLDIPNYVAQSIHRIQFIFGRIRNIYCKGNVSKTIYQIIKQKQNDVKLQNTYGDIQTLVIIDRMVDIVTPLCKQLVYEGLIDQFLNKTGYYITIPAKILQQRQLDQSKNVTLSLNSQKDYIYQEIRSVNIQACNSILNKKAKKLDQLTNEAKSSQLKQKFAATKRVTQQKQYLKKLAHIIEKMSKISYHKQILMEQRCLIQGGKQILQYIQHIFPFEIPLNNILPTLCLHSIIQKGIPSNIYKNICNDIVQCYGMHHIVTIYNLQKLGFINQKGNINYPYTQIKKQFKLINESPINHQNPSNISFAYGGLIPLSCHLVQAVLNNQWKNIKALNKVPGFSIIPDKIQYYQGEAKPVVIVFFVGGITYGEVAALRLLGKLYSKIIQLEKQMVIATTQIINNKKLMDYIIQQIQ